MSLETCLDKNMVLPMLCQEYGFTPPIAFPGTQLILWEFLGLTVTLCNWFVVWVFFIFTHYRE